MVKKSFALKLDEEVRKKFKVYAAQQGLTMQAILEQYVFSLVGKE